MKRSTLFWGIICFLSLPGFTNLCKAQTGSITMETWANITGSAISTIPVNSAPTSATSISQFEAPRNTGDNYGRRIRGYIYPPVSGNYTFWIASDNNSELWLSTTSLPQNKVKIASVTGWTNYREWTKYTTQKSVVKYLTAGQKYYIEALHKEQNLADHISVGWQLPSGTQEMPVPGNRLSPYTVVVSAGITFAMIGDYGSNTTNEGAVAALVKSWQPAFIITPGDNNPPAGAKATIDINIGKYYHEYIYPYTGTYGAGAKVNSFFPGLGNHDVMTSGGSPYFNYFTLPGNERYYDFVKGDVHFYVINSNPSESSGTSSTSVQAIWLKNKLAASASKWDIVYFHHSPYASDVMHGSISYMQWPFKEWGADAVMSGHSHIYERVIVNNFPYFINGLGGHSIYGLKATPVAGSKKRYNLGYGAIQIKATSTSLAFKFYNTANTLIDSYTLTKPAAAAPATKTKASPIPVITVKGPRVLNNIEKTALRTRFDSAAVYQWKVNDIIITGENKNYIIASKPGSYKVQVIKNGSLAISESINITGIPEEVPAYLADTAGRASKKLNKDEKTYDLKVYPNPNNGVFKIAINMPIQKESAIKVQVMNNLGQIVYNKEFLSGNRYIIETIELDKALPQGIYNLQIMVGNKTENISMVLLK